MTKSTINYHNYHRHGRTDLSVMRRDGEYRAREGYTTLIHLHAKEEASPYPTCLDQLDHEYIYGDDVDVKGE